MFEAMAELEALCAGLAAERMTGTERRALELVHEEMRALIRIGDPQRFHEVNEAFHGAIYAGAHNAYLAEVFADAGAHDEELLQLFHRRYLRYKMLLGPAGSAMATHHPIQKFSHAR